MPTKTEQSDLFQAVFGRNGDAPVPVVAPASPGECFAYAIEAWRLAIRHMTPVIYLSDAFLGTGSEPWRIPEMSELPDLRAPNHAEAEGWYPYIRDPETLARPWVVPGTPGLEHRIGGLEKLDILGTVSYDPDNHHRMSLNRAEKVARIANDIPPLEVFGPPEGDLLILGWGSSYGAIRSAVERLQGRGKSIAHAHLRHLNPFPRNTGDVVRSYRKVLVPEVNMGQLLFLIRGTYLVDAIGFNLVRGKPFQISEIQIKAEQLLGDL
jgi:2-oxoglutarate ferredoxin oxidoreductase subunit alpha